MPYQREVKSSDLSHDFSCYMLKNVQCENGHRYYRQHQFAFLPLPNKTVSAHSVHPRKAYPTQAETTPCIPLPDGNAQPGHQRGLEKGIRDLKDVADERGLPIDAMLS